MSCNITDTPLNLSTTNNASDNVLSTIPEHKSQNFQAGCKVWSEKTPPIVPETLCSADWTDHVATASEGSLSTSPQCSPFIERPFSQFQLSPVKYRGPKHPVPEEMKDERYFKRRHRNNEAAKRSRLARKERQETELHRIALIEIENAALRTQMLSLRAEYETLAHMLFRRRELLGAAILQRQENTSESVSDVKEEEVN